MGNEKMDVQKSMEGKIPTAQLPTKFMLMVRIMAGVYVTYVAYTVKDNLASAAGAEKAFFTIAVIAFPIIGLFLIIHSIRALKMGRYVDGEMDAGKAERDETEDVAENSRTTCSDDDE